MSLRFPFLGRGQQLAALSLLIFGVTAPLQAQYETAPPPAAWALEGVTVIHADFRTEAGMTLVVRGGVIETLRAGAPVPPDARRIEGSGNSLYVYPGIIDLHGGVSVEAPTPSREGVQSWNPTREVQFFTPHREAANLLAMNGTGLAGERRRGVVASLVYPGRGPLPGQTSLILHRPDARTGADLVLRPSVGLAAAWQGAQGAYPGTLMAQHAFFRQSFLDAGHYAAHRDAYARNPRGLTTVTRDADYEVLLAAVAGSLPVHFQANGAEDIRRVLSLSEELGFRPVLVGASEAGGLAEALGRRRLPAFVSAAFPDPQDWKIDEANGDETPAAFRERQRLEPIYRTPALLAEAGVPFALTSGGNSSTDLLKGARRAIQFGLSEASALRALTSTPAELAGVPQLVRIEEGLSATFLVTDRPLFHEEAGVVWTFVNGHAEKGRDPRAPRPEGGATGAQGAQPQAAAAAAGFVGRWSGSLSGAGQSWPVVVTFRESEGRLLGTATSDAGPSLDLQEVSLQGDRIRFALPVPQAAGALARFEGILEGDRVTGTGTLQAGDTAFPFTFEFRRGPGGALR